MQQEFIYRIISICVLFITAEILAYYAFHALLQKKNRTLKSSLLSKYKIFTVVFIAVIFPLFIYTAISKGEHQYNFFIAAVILLVYLPKFILGLVWLAGIIVFFIIKSLLAFFKANHRLKIKEGIYGIKYFFSYTGLILSFVSALLVLYGMTYGITDFRVREIMIESSRVPAAFDGFRVIQISDLHLGSFNGKSQVEKGLKLISENKPDVLVLTGDIVNSDPDEATGYIDIFRALHVPYGKYAVLGNHDMDDYMKWMGKEGDSSMGSNVVKCLRKMDFVVLRNQNVVVNKGTDSINITGLDNWGKPPFKKYADINKAFKNVDKQLFNILLLHDPGPWEQSVLPAYNVDLTLSGHTHGMQLGYDYRNFRWSFAGLRYKHCLGLYNEKGKKLYVNPGFGFLGFAARIGMPPEITVFILKKTGKY